MTLFFMLFFFLKINLGCAGSQLRHAGFQLRHGNSQLWHAGCSSPTWDRTWAPCIGRAESYPLDPQGSPILFCVSIFPYNQQLCTFSPLFQLKRDQGQPPGPAGTLVHQARGPDSPLQQHQDTRQHLFILRAELGQSTDGACIYEANTIYCQGSERAIQSQAGPTQQAQPDTMKQGASVTWTPPASTPCLSRGRKPCSWVPGVLFSIN